MSLLERILIGQSNTTIFVCSVNEALDLIPDEMRRQWYQWQPGVLQFFSPIPGYLGGLTLDKSRAVLVAFPLYNDRRRTLLRQLAQQVLKSGEKEAEAFCDQAEQEVQMDISPRPHPAFAAEAEARQVQYWLEMLSKQSQP